MNGYQITFLTVEGHTHKGKPAGHWLIDLAKEMGLPGATLLPALEGFGGHGQSVELRLAKIRRARREREAAREAEAEVEWDL